jgi:hypothetical protein
VTDFSAGLDMSNPYSLIESFQRLSVSLWDKFSRLLLLFPQPIFASCYLLNLKRELKEVKAEVEKGLQDKELLEQLPWKSTKGAVRTTNWNEDAFLYVEEWGLDEAKQNFLNALVEKLKEAPFFVEGKWIWLDRNRYVKRTSEAPPATQK